MTDLILIFAAIILYSLVLIYCSHKRGFAFGFGLFCAAMQLDPEHVWQKCKDHISKIRSNK